MLSRKTLIVGYLSLVLTGVVASQADARPQHKLAVTDISGYYAAVDKNALEQTLYIHLVKPYTNSGFDQADFTGKFGNSPMVGQGIISGDEGESDDWITFAFMFLEPQDVTVIEFCKTVQDDDGNVVAVLVSGDDEYKSYTKYHRVSRAQYLKIYRKSESDLDRSFGGQRPYRH